MIPLSTIVEGKILREKNKITSCICDKLMAVNWEIVDELMALDEDDPTHSFTRQIFEDYFVQMEERLPELAKLAQARAFDEVGKVGHSLKGSSAAVGALGVSEICEKICAKVKEWEKTRQEPQPYLLRRISELKSLYPTVKKQLLSKISA